MSKEDADIVRKKLLNLTTCPRCHKDFHEKDIHRVRSGGAEVLAEDIIYSCKSCINADIERLSEDIRADQGRRGR